MEIGVWLGWSTDNKLAGLPIVSAARTASFISTPVYCPLVVGVSQQHRGGGKVYAKADLDQTLVSNSLHKNPATKGHPSNQPVHHITRKCGETGQLSRMVGYEVPQKRDGILRARFICSLGGWRGEQRGWEPERTRKPVGYTQHRQESEAHAA